MFPVKRFYKTLGTANIDTPFQTVQQGVIEMNDTAESSQTRSERREQRRNAKASMVHGKEMRREVKFKAEKKARSITRDLARKQKEVVYG